MKTSNIHQLFLQSTGVCTDTRKIIPNQIFIGLSGDNFNGNNYALQAIEKGASFAIVDDPELKHEKIIHVKNTLETLQELANYHRNFLDIPIIALTGSNGKTTTKELINAVLSLKYNCTATKGNLNNHIGVPLTLLSMTTDTEIGVVEMGANHMHEIEELSKIAAPNYGYITNIGKAHLEGFGSEENILIGKTELYDYIKKNNGTLFCNAEDEKLFPLANQTKSLFFSKNKNKHLLVDLIAVDPFITISYNNSVIESQLIGTYNYTNIAASILIGNYFNVKDTDIKNAIENYRPKNNRSELVYKGSNSIILDAYNANPSSMSEALSHLHKISTSKKRKIALLGDMFEMGKYAKKEHQHIADLAATLNIDKVLLVGENFSACNTNSPKVNSFEKVESLLLHLSETEYSDCLFLIKGSRGMKLEQTLEIF